LHTKTQKHHLKYPNVTPKCAYIKGHTVNNIFVEKCLTLTNNTILAIGGRDTLRPLGI
jgi:hypothetical protein